MVGDLRIGMQCFLYFILMAGVAISLVPWRPVGHPFTSMLPIKCIFVCGRARDPVNFVTESMLVTDRT